MNSPVVYYGGKTYLIKHLLRLVPSGGKPYVEAYCGGASLFFARNPTPAEVLNDLNGEIVNLFRCLQNRETFEELKHRLNWTLYSRAEFERALEINETADPVTRAWATFVKLNQGFNGLLHKTVGNWRRSFIENLYWGNKTSRLDLVHDRLMNVQIDNRDAIEVIKYWDSPDTVFYLDPPYYPDVRRSLDTYNVEADDKHHRVLVDTILKCEGSVVLSGYYHDVYKPLEEAGWERIDIGAVCWSIVRKLNEKDNYKDKVPRTESIWINPKARSKKPRLHGVPVNSVNLKDLKSRFYICSENGHKGENNESGRKI